MWKFLDEVTKAKLCHWADSVDVQLEALRGFEFPDIVLNTVRRSETEISDVSLKTMIESVSE